MDDTRICDLKTVLQVFAADLHYHRACFPEYRNKYMQSCCAQQDVARIPGKRQVFQKYASLIEDVISTGKGLSLSDIRDMINGDINADDFRNNEVKMFFV